MYVQSGQGFIPYQSDVYGTIASDMCYKYGNALHGQSTNTTRYSGSKEGWSNVHRSSLVPLYTSTVLETTISTAFKTIPTIPTPSDLAPHEYGRKLTGNVHITHGNQKVEFFTGVKNLPKFQH